MFSTITVQQAMRRAIKAGILYFLFVFGAGFLLGPIRIIFLVPRFGTRTSELLEMPIMLVVIIISARVVIRRLDVTQSGRLAMGLVAVVLLLSAEFTLVMWLRGVSIADYLASRDPVAGTAYYAMIVVFAAMPLFISKR